MVAITPLTAAILGRVDADNCSVEALEDSRAVTPGSLLPTLPANRPSFEPLSGPTARVGVFAATHGGFTRCFIVALPESGRAERLVVAVPPTYGQAEDYYRRLGATDPQSPALLQDTLAVVTGAHRAGQVQPVYGTQVLRSGVARALVFPVRALAARPQELGTFVSNGSVLRETLEALAPACGGAFNLTRVEVFTHSNGIYDCNNVVAALRRAGVGVTGAVALDPYRATPLSAVPGMRVRQYMSGESGGLVGGRPPGNFIYLPLARWANEPDRALVLGRVHNSHFQYLHNYAFPKYLLRVGLMELNP